MVTFINKQRMVKLERELASAQKEIADLKERLRWVPVSERLPEEEANRTEVNVICEGVPTAHRHHKGKWYFYDTDKEDYVECLSEHTHWMEIPEMEE
jgi:hypothetical protein